MKVQLTCTSHIQLTNWLLTLANPIEIFIFEGTGSRPRVLQKEFDRAVLKYLRNGEFYELAVHTWRASLSNIVIEHIISDNDEIQYFSNFPSFKK